VRRVRRGGAAARLGMRAGDRLERINGKPVADVLDAQFFAADGVASLTWERDGRRRTQTAARMLALPLGLEFCHPTFDKAIRRCNNRCRFCFVVQMAPGWRATLHVKDDDYRYSFLYGHFVTLTNLRDADWRKIAEQRLSPLYVSVHATEPALRAGLLGNPRAGDILERLRWLASAGITVHAQVVLAPGWNDGAHLRRTVADLSRLYPHVRSCSVVPVGLTRFHRQGLRVYAGEEKKAVVEEVETWQDDFLPRLGSRFVFLTDEWYLSAGRAVPPAEDYEDLDLRENGLGLVRGFLDGWDAWVCRPRSWPGKIRGAEALLVTGALFAPVLAETAAACNKLAGTRLRVLAVANRRLGATVTVAGLLTAGDVVAALQTEPALPEHIILPRVMFDHPQALALDDLTPLDVARALGAKVCLADSMPGVVRVLAGGEPMCVGPRRRRLPRAFLRAGGWIE
jgi:putative radical SAM enzyme (TIGR03279 family)